MGESHSPISRLRFNTGFKLLGFMPGIDLGQFLFNIKPQLYINLGTVELDT